MKDADGHVQPCDDTDSGVAWSGPLVVLISKFSASASEILAGAIQDYDRGLIVGDHSTHGKGTVQSLMDLGQQLFRLPNAPPMGALKITMQQFYRPNGDSTQKRGVLADIELPSLTTHLDVGEADLDYPVRVRQGRAGSTTSDFDDVNPAVCDQLRQLSQQRVQASEKFQKVVRNIARYKEQKAKKYVTLNEEKFLKERAELNADKEEEKAIEKHSDLNNGGIERDYYLDEALAIIDRLPEPPARGEGADSGGGRGETNRDMPRTVWQTLCRVPATQSWAHWRLRSSVNRVALYPATRRSLVACRPHTACGRHGSCTRRRVSRYRRPLAPINELPILAAVAAMAET